MRHAPAAFTAFLFSCLVGSGQAERFDASTEQTILLKSDASVWVMGSNYSGQAGLGTSFNDVLMQQQTAADAVAVAAGAYSNFFIKSDKTLWGMGSNMHGELGNGTTISSSVPIPISGNIVAVASKNGTTFFIKTDHTLWGMGKNDAGQLGDGTTIDRLIPVKIADGVQSVSVGAQHAGFVKADGTLWTMGKNSSGQLGDGTTTNRNTPAQVATGVASVHLGGSHSLVIKEDKTLWATGENSGGQLGDGTTTDRLSLVKITDNVLTASASSACSYFVNTSHVLLGAGTRPGPNMDYFAPPVVTPISLEDNVQAVATAETHTVFRRQDGSFWAFGSNSCGPFGLGIYGGIFTKSVQISSGAPVSLQTVATPQASPPAGNYSVTKTITLSSSTPGATILYTLRPGYQATDGTQYEGPFLLVESAILKAIAVKGGYLPSGDLEASYGIFGPAPSVAAPVFSPNGGKFWTNSLQVTISTRTKGAEIHYEIGDLEPTLASPKYTGPIQLTAPFYSKISARAYKDGLKVSAIREVDFEINPADNPTKVVTPSINAKSTTFERSQSVTITCRTKGATIYYTLDGTTPTTSSQKYKKAIRIKSTTTIKAFAVKDGLADSDPATLRLREL